jgi:hypothetical protein
MYLLLENLEVENYMGIKKPLTMPNIINFFFFLFINKVLKWFGG